MDLLSRNIQCYNRRYHSFSPFYLRGIIFRMRAPIYMCQKLRKLRCSNVTTFCVSPTPPTFSKHPQSGGSSFFNGESFSLHVTLNGACSLNEATDTRDLRDWTYLYREIILQVLSVLISNWVTVSVCHHKQQ